MSGISEMMRKQVAIKGVLSIEEVLGGLIMCQTVKVKNKHTNPLCNFR